jgi:hypothetical protein
MPATSPTEKPSHWNSYGLDQIAQRLVLDAKGRDPQSLNQAYKMRMATAYGLERFWGEHLRLERRDSAGASFWQDTWTALVQVMGQAGVTIPNQSVNADNVQSIRTMSEQLWQIPPEDQRVALAVLTQLCDCIVWWTQRYK